MTAMVVGREAQIGEPCRRFGVRRLALFGSAARDAAEPRDLDLLVEFEPTDSPNGAADRYFGLREGLEALFGKPIDLVVAGTVRNPYLLRAIEADLKPLYAA